MFYKKVIKSSGKISYVKCVPDNISELLSPEGLAYWIIGHGSKQNKGLHLSIYNFTSIECELLIKALSSKWELKCSVPALQTNKGPPSTCSIHDKNSDSGPGSHA